MLVCFVISICVHCTGLQYKDFRVRDFFCFFGDTLVWTASYTDAQYEPGTVANYLRILFALFSRRGVPYSQTKDFNDTGKFMDLFWAHSSPRYYIFGINLH